MGKGKSDFMCLVEVACQKLGYADTVTTLGKIFDEHLAELKYTDVIKYDELIDELHIGIHGYHFTEDLLDEAVTSFINEDGTKGPKWSVDETTSLAVNAGIVFDKFNKFDWNYVLNLMYSDYYSMFGGNVQTYISLADKFFNDKDVQKDKAYLYYKNVMCG